MTVQEWLGQRPLGQHENHGWQSDADAPYRDRTDNTAAPEWIPTWRPWPLPDIRPGGYERYERPWWRETDRTPAAPPPQPAVEPASNPPAEGALEEPEEDMLTWPFSQEELDSLTSQDLIIKAVQVAAANSAEVLEFFRNHSEAYTRLADAITHRGLSNVLVSSIIDGELTDFISILMWIVTDAAGSGIECPGQAERDAELARSILFGPATAKKKKKKAAKNTADCEPAKPKPPTKEERHDQARRAPQGFFENDLLEEDRAL